MDSNQSSSSDEQGHLCTSCSKHPGRGSSGARAAFLSLPPLRGPHYLWAPQHPARGPHSAYRGPLLHSRGVGTVNRSRRRAVPPPPRTPALHQHSAGERFPRPRPAPPLQSPHSSRGCNRQSRRTNGAASGDGAGPREGRASPLPRPELAPGAGYSRAMTGLLSWC